MSRDEINEARFILNGLAQELHEADIPSARRDANLILQMALGKDEPILMHHEVALSAQSKAQLTDLMSRRKAGSPISRLRGHREFYSLDFALNAATLDPRPESELIVDAAIAQCGKQALRIADFGTGSGCLLIATLAHCQAASGIGLDLSPEAIACASVNAKTHQLSDRAVFTVSDWDGALDDEARFDIILSNPPYIARGDAPHLAPEVRLYDPPLALFAGSSGLTAYERLMSIFAKRLVRGGLCLVEIGQGQESQVQHLAAQAGLVAQGHLTDLAGIIRVLKFTI